MMCEKLRDDFMEAVLSGPETVSPQLQEHLQSCPACARELASFQQTMSVLDEWQAPEPSPYFSSRLRARMREATAMQPSGWLAWLRRPVAAAAAAVLVAAGAGLIGRWGGGVSPGRGAPAAGWRGRAGRWPRPPR